MRRSYLAILLFVVLLFPVLVAKADPIIAGCQIFPADNPWNTDISDPILYPVDPNSAAYIANINAHGGDYVHPDFGSDPTYGIPYNIVPGTQPKVPITFDPEAADESDPGPYPIPPTALIEAGDDRHVLVLDRDNCILYETYASEYVGGAQHAWTAYSGAIFHLDSNALRPDGWTSADAAGLPILPGLARCDEVTSGEITHALRFTVAHTQMAYVYPATHYASTDTNPNAPPMGLRFRLKADYDLSTVTGQALVIAKALKQYGMMIADKGSNWYISGEADPSPGCWDDDDLNQLKAIPGTAFEVVGKQGPSAAPFPNQFTVSTPTLTWNAVTWATQYKVQVSSDANFNHIVVEDDVNAAELFYTLPDPLDNGLYYWRVQAQDGTGQWGTWSAGQAFQVKS